MTSSLRTLATCRPVQPSSPGSGPDACGDISREALRWARSLAPSRASGGGVADAGALSRRSLTSQSAFIKAAWLAAGSLASLVGVCTVRLASALSGVSVFAHVGMTTRNGARLGRSGLPEEF